MLMLVPYILLPLAAGLWAVSLISVDHSALLQMGDLGLTPLLPWTFFAALLALLVGFPFLLQRTRLPTMMSGLYLLALVTILHGTPAILYGTPRYPFSYKHIGVSNHIQQHGSVDPLIDAYFNWPGFFALSALFGELDPSLAPFHVAVWGPLFMNVLILLGLCFLLRSLDARPTMIALSLWLYQLGSWVAQDYFAPQAFAFLQHLTLLGVYVGYFTRTHWRGDAEPPLRSNAAQRSGMLVLMAILFGSIVVSHQLTPFVTVASVGALVLLRMGRQWPFLLVMVSLLVAHFTYLARTYFSGHLGELLGYVGRLTDNLAFASEVLVSAAGDVSTERAIVLMVRQALTLVVAGMAVVGWGRRRKQGLPTWPATILAFVPATMVALQPYGGEIFMRVYLFSLPFLAFFAAALLLPAPGWGMETRRLLSVIGVSIVLAAGNLVSYYGNERMNFIAPDELEALQRLLVEAPEGAFVVTQTNNAPIRHARYDELTYLPLPNLVERADLNPSLSDPDALADAMLEAAALAGAPGTGRVEGAAGGAGAQGAPAYLLLTRSQLGNAELFGVLPEVDWESLPRQLAASPRFTTVYRSPGGSVFALQPPGAVNP